VSLNCLAGARGVGSLSGSDLDGATQDTTESLSILDSKFSGQHRDLDSKISSLQESVNKVPTKVEFEKVRPQHLSANS
jgi:hypothetical protein